MYVHITLGEPGKGHAASGCPRPAPPRLQRPEAPRRGLGHRGCDPRECWMDQPRVTVCISYYDKWSNLVNYIMAYSSLIHYSDSFQTGSGKTGSSQKCRDSPEWTFTGKCVQHITTYHNIWHSMATCGNMWQNMMKCGNTCALKATHDKM